ncbi:MAG: hypothetical protein WD768_10500 [Phycisphaeraceae bacterium]
MDYGYVVARSPDDGWWHMHFGRGTVEYDCEMLGRCTNIFAVVQHLERGGVAKSPQYILTLDGEGVDRPVSDLALDFLWSGIAGVPGFADEAIRFQQEVIPLLHSSEPMQLAVATIVQSDRHLRLVAPNKLRF